jgi:hypothetical protein
MAIGAGLGAVSSIISTSQRAKEEQENIRWKQQQAQQQYQYQQQYSNQQWDINKQESLTQLGIQKNRLAQSFNADLQGFNLGVQSQAYATTAARIEQAQGAGEALAAQGMSGVSGSNTLSRQLQYGNNALERQIGLQDSQNMLTMQNMTRQYSYNFEDIGREMESWEEGGYRNELREAEQEYQENMFGLEMKGYEYAYQNAEPTFMDYAAGILGGASSGASFGSQIQGFIDQIGVSRLSSASAASGGTSGGSASAAGGAAAASSVDGGALSAQAASAANANYYSQLNSQYGTTAGGAAPAYSQAQIALASSVNSGLITPYAAAKVGIDYSGISDSLFMPRADALSYIYGKGGKNDYLAAFGGRK